VQTNIDLGLCERTRQQSLQYVSDIPKLYRQTAWRSKSCKHI